MSAQLLIALAQYSPAPPLLAQMPSLAERASVQTHPEPLQIKAKSLLLAEMPFLPKAKSLLLAEMPFLPKEKSLLLAEMSFLPKEKSLKLY